MRKSERLRLLELQVLELQKDVEIILSILQVLVEDEAKMPNLESGKWYKNKSE
jgi:hypothetical protein